MTAKLMNGTYYEIDGFSSHTIVNVESEKCYFNDESARAKAADEESTAYKNTYKNGKRIKSIKLYDPYGDSYYPTYRENGFKDAIYYEPLPYDMQFRYQMLGRLKSDCDYFLGNGYGYEGHLWASSVEKQIAEMKRRWNEFEEDEKPEWLTMEQIEEYERNMLQARESRKKAEENMEPGKSYSFRWEVDND